MAKSSKIKLMISGRCNDTSPLGASRLSEIRIKLKQEIEAALVLDERSCKIWINEKATANCSDETETQHGEQRFLAWLPQPEQSGALVQFARKRKQLV